MSGTAPSPQLEAGVGTPIAKLSPELADLKSHVVRGVVTITWPYSSINKSIAFILAEPDFRLRRAKGQVRVEFKGSSASAVASSGLGGGDEVTLSLEGVEWVKDDSTTRTPGSSLDWQLKYGERLLLQAKVGDSQDVRLIDIDGPPLSNPEPEPERPTVSVLDELPGTLTPQREPSPELGIPAKRPATSSLGPDEYASPAFIKRARVSYGSLFEGGIDIFDEDGGAKGRGRKRTRFGRDSSAWRYSSQSRSPEPEPLQEQEDEDDSMRDEATASSPPRPQMMDEGSQTVELDFSPPRDVQVAAEPRASRQQFIQTPTKISTTADTGIQPEPPDIVFTPVTGSMPEMNGHHVGLPALPGFTSTQFQFAQPPLQEHYFDEIQQPLHHHDDVTAHYEPRSPFHDQPVGYQDTGIHHELQVQDDYPTSFLDAPNFVPQVPSDQTAGFAGDVQQHDDHYGYGGSHHTILIDGVAEPQQMAWGLSRAPPEYAPLSSEAQPTATVEVTSSSPLRAQLGDSFPHEETSADIDSDEDGGELDPEIQDDVSEQQGGDRVGEDEIPEDHGTPGETYASDRLANIPDEEEVSEEDEDSEEEADHEEDDAGGDYDIVKYRNLSNVQDDDDGTDLESDYGQVQTEAEIFDPDGQGDEEDELEEGYGESDQDDEYDEDPEFDEDAEQENIRPRLTVPKAPIVISLLSDSEDDDSAPSPMPAPQQVVQRAGQYDGSDDEMDDSEMEEDDDDSGEDQALSDSPQVENAPEPRLKDSSPPLSSTSMAQDTPSSPQTKHRSEVESALELPEPLATNLSTSGEQSLENMSPIRPLRTRELLEDAKSRSISRGGSEALEVELREELEQQLRDDDEQEHQQESSTGNIETVPVVQATKEFEGAGSISVDEVANIIESPLDESHEALQGEAEDEIMSGVNDELIAEERDLAQYGSPLVPDEVDVRSDSPIAQITEQLEVVIESTAIELSVITEPEMTNPPNLEADGNMDVDVPSTDLKQIEPTSPPLTQQFQSQSFEDIKQVEINQITEEDVNMEEDVDQLPTPGDTQQAEVMPVETQVTEDGGILQVLPEFVEESQPGLAEAAVAASKVSSSVPATSSEPSMPTLADAEHIQGTVSTQQKPDAVSEVERTPPQPRDASPVPSEAQSSVIQDEGAEDIITAKSATKKGRGHRRNKSDQKGEDPSIQLARASLASRRSTRLSDRTTPETLRITRARSHSLLKSDTPEPEEDTSIQLAKAALNSPSRVVEEEKQPFSPMRVQLSKSLRADVPDCISLKVLRNHPGKTVDVMAIATTQPPEPKRAKGGPRGIMLAFNITDQSTAPTQVVAVHIFRPHKTALPVVHPGDAILLRGFSVVAMKGRGFGLRAGDASSWAVFESQGEDDLPQIRGPPVELSEGEAAYAALLKKWYGGLDDKAVGKLDKANQKALEAGEEIK